MVRPMTWYWLLGLGLATAGCGDSGGFETAGFGTEGSLSGGSTGEADTGVTPPPTTGEAPPEVEDEGAFRVPRASGKYVYSASETTDSVAVIDTAKLAIDVVEVGRGPTVVEPIPGLGGAAGGAVVLDQGSDDVAVLRTSEAGATTVELHRVTAGANNVAVAPDGAYALVYHDVDGPEQLGPGSDQELTVLDLQRGTTHSMTVGAHPREVVFASDHTRAWVITAAGVNVIEFAGLGEVGKPPLVPVIGDPGIDPATLEVQVTASDGVALARVDGAPWLAVTDLASGALTVIDLPGSPTDLDVAPSGAFAVLTIPGEGGSQFLELPLPLVGGGEFVAHAVDGEYVGQTAVADSGDAMLLFTTVDPYARTAGPPDELRAPEVEPLYASTGESSSGGGGSSTGGSESTGEGGGDEPHGDPRQRITLARRDGGAWSLVTLFVEVPVVSVGVAPDSRNAILVHAKDPASPKSAYSYSLFDITP